MRKEEDFKLKFQELINSEDTPDHIRFLLSCCLESDKPDLDVWSFVYEVKDDISPELADVFEFFLQKGASLKWFMLLITVYEEKIVDSMLYMKLFRDCFVNGLDVEVLDECQKNTSDFQEFQKLIKAELQKDHPRESIHNSEFAALQQDNASLRALLDAHVKELSKLRMEFMELQKENFGYRRQSMHLENELQSLKKDNEHLSSLKRLSERKVESVQKLCGSLKRINDELSASVKETDGKKDGINEEMYRVLENEFTAMKEKYEAAIQKNSSLESEYSALRNEKYAIDKKCQSLLAENKDMGIRCKKLAEELEEERAKKDFNDDTDSFIKEMNEELHKNTISIMREADEEEENDFEPSELVSMVPDEQEINTHRSFFRKLIDQFKDREFTLMPVHEQTGRIFTKMIERDFPKDTIKLVSETLKANKKMKRVELYRMVEKNASPDECERYCKNIGAA